MVYGIIKLDGNYHFFKMADGCVFDLTSEQFGDEVLDYGNCLKQFREVHLAKEKNGCVMNICGHSFWTGIRLSYTMGTE